MTNDLKSVKFSKESIVMAEVGVMLNTWGAEPRSKKNLDKKFEIRVFVPIDSSSQAMPESYSLLANKGWSCDRDLWNSLRRFEKSNVNKLEWRSRSQTQKSA